MLRCMANNRAECLKDLDQVRDLYEEAFNEPVEADLVDSLRESGRIAVAIVAELDQEIVGHILFSPASIEGAKIKIAALGPVAVLPEYQGRQIGSELVQDGLDECLSLGYDAVIVLGDADFYSRFDFKSASEFGIEPQWDGIPDEAFMILELHTGVLEGVSGIAHYAPEFDDVMRQSAA